MLNQSTSKALCLIQIRCAGVLRSLWSLISTESRQECLEELGHQVPLGEIPDSTTHPQGERARAGGNTHCFH